MKQLIENYSFNSSERTVTLFGLPSINLEQLLLITNVTTNTMIYNFADATIGASIADNVITLSYDTTSMSSADRLQIFVDISNSLITEGQLEDVMEQFTYDTNLEKVLGTQPLTDQGNLKTKTIYSQNKVIGRIGSLNESLGIDCDGLNTVAIQISGTWAGTLTFEARADSGNYMPIQALNVAGASLGSTTTSSTIARINCAGLMRVQCRFSVYTSGTAQIALVASGSKVDSPGTVTVAGTQTTLQQRATTYEANTWDTNLATVLGSVQLWRPGFTAVDPLIAPTVNPAQPSTYADTKYSQYPQYFARLRVEAGGSQKLPFAQAQSNRLLVEYPEELSLLEQILIQLQIFNQNYATVNNTGLPNGTAEMK